MAYFLVKTEPTTYSIGDLVREKVTSWGGIRNYQARNVLREMQKRDVCVVYHSSCAVPGAVGIATVVKEAYPDPLQFDRKSDYFDAGSHVADPRWSAVDLRFTERFARVVTLEEMRDERALRACRLLARGNRLSVLPLTNGEYEAIIALSSRGAL